MTLTEKITSTKHSQHLRSGISTQHRHSIRHPGQLSLLCIAVSAALSAMLPTQVLAQQVTIDSGSSYNTTYTLSGGDLSITNTGSITSAGSDAIRVGTGAVGTVDNAGSISAFSLGVYTSAASNIATFTNSGRIYGNSAAMEVNGSIGSLSNSATIIGGAVGINNTAVGTITSLSNSSTGTITGGAYAFINDGNMGTLNNQGAIHSNLHGILNSGGGTLGTLINDGTISAGNNGIMNGPLSGTLSTQIGSLSNTDLIESTGTTGTIAAVNNLRYGTIDNLSNTGTIRGVALAVSNAGFINTLTNSGLIQETGTLAAISNTSFGTIGTLLVNGGSITGYSGISNAGLVSNLNISSGTIYGSAIGIDNNTGTMTILTNAGTIQGGVTGILNRGTIGTLSNSGVLSGSLYALALNSSASLGTLNNSGLVAGNVLNLSSNALTINGGSGSVFGTLTGNTGSITSAAIGLITSSGANVVFGGGNMLLNNNINVGTNTVNNAGSVLQVNNHLTITGNYSQGASATLLVGVNDGATATGSAIDTGYGYLRVQGNSTIASGSTIGLTKTNSYAFANGQKYVAVITTGTANYTASALNYSLAGFTVTGANVADGGNTNLVLTLGNTGTGSTAVNGLATTSNAVSALTQLFNYSGANVNLLNVFNAAAALGTTAEANKAGAVLSPTANTVAATQSSTAATTQVLGIVAAHVDGLRVAQARGDSGISTGETRNEWSGWGQAFGGNAHQDMRDNVSGFRSSYSGLVLGADRLVSERWRAGGLLSYASNSVSGRDDNTGSLSKVKSYGLMGYGGYAADDWYLDVVAGAFEHKYDSNRLIDFTGFSGIANGRFDGRQYATSVQVGKPIQLGGEWTRTTVTPIAALGYSTTRQNAYTETGGNGAALNVGKSNYSSVKSELGVKIERAITTSYGDVVPAVQVGWRHEFRDRAVQSLSSFAADSTGTTSFTSTGATPVQDTGVLALSATLLRRNNLTFVARYTLESGSGYTAQTGDLRLRYQF